MARIIERRFLAKEDLQSLCVARDLYTEGTTDEYRNLLSLWCFKDHIDTATIEKLADDIWEHSDCEQMEKKYWYKTDLMRAIAGRCVTYFVEEAGDDSESVQISDVRKTLEKYLADELVDDIIKDLKKGEN